MESDSIITFFIVLLILHLFLLLGLKKYLHHKESYETISSSEMKKILENLYQENLKTYVEMRRKNSPKTSTFLEQVYNTGHKLDLTQEKIDEDIFNLLTSSSSSPSSPSSSPS